MLDSLRKDDEPLANIQARWSELAELLEETLRYEPVGHHVL